MSKVVNTLRRCWQLISPYIIIAALLLAALLCAYLGLMAGH